MNGKPEKKEHGQGQGQDSGRFDTTAKDECSVYVANLNKPIKREEVRKLFEPFGAVEDVHTPLGKNFCFVRFAGAESVDKVLKAGSLVLNDATLAISRKKATRDRAPGDRPTRGAFRGGRGGGGAGDGRGRPPFKANGAGPSAGAKAAESNDGFTEANSRRNRPKRHQQQQQQQ